MTKDQLEYLHQISETVSLLSRQLGNFVDSFQASTSIVEVNDDKTRETNIAQTSPDANGTEKNVESLAYPPMYFGAPSGKGFEDNNRLMSSTSTKCLYVILKKSEKEARYYPIPEKLSRFKLNPDSLFNDVCNTVGNLSEATSIEFTEDDYGELTYEYEKGYWKVTKECIVFCNK